MSWQIAFVLFMILLMIIALIREMARPDMVIFATLVVFLLTGIITPDEALKGFSNEGMLTIALLFIIAGVIQKSGLFGGWMGKLLGKKAQGPLSLIRMMVPVSGLSAFLNNTPIVVTFTPFIRKWCQDHGLSPSKFLIPLSYATILGGMITLMGTSTTLVVHGLMIKEIGHGFTVFELAIVGIPATILGLVYLATIGYRLLPDIKGRDDELIVGGREYLAEMLVEASYPFINKSVEQAGLRQLKGLFLVEIIRQEEKISPVKSTTLIKKNDRLIFTGDVSTIAELQNTKGLRLDPASDISVDRLINENNYVVEVIVSHHSALINKTIKASNFRGKYDAAVIAVHRNHERIHGKIGSIVLKPGDTLLVLAGNDFLVRQDLTDDFYVVTPIDNPFVKKADIKSGWIAIGTLIAMIALVTAGVLSMFKAMAFEVILLLLLRVTSAQEAKKAMQFNVLLIVASSIGIGEALTESGAANWIAHGLVQFGKPFGIIVVLFLVYFLTNIFTELISHAAAAVMMFPIAMSIASDLHLNPEAFAVIIAIAASASFVTPIGYQTNLIVYGPGGYQFKDYVKVGLPLSCIVMVTTVLIVNQVWIG
jgi:di/tricarboxylate transporter